MLKLSLALLVAATACSKSKCELQLGKLLVDRQEMSASLRCR